MEDNFKKDLLRRIGVAEAAINNVKKILAETSEQESVPERISKEARFYELANNLTQRFDKDKYPNSVFYFRGDDYMFEIENSTIWCSYQKVWSIFKKEYSMQYSKIQLFVAIQVEEHFKRKGLTPKSYLYKSCFRVEEHFKRKGLTPHM